jgi:hypothetical protein
MAAWRAMANVTAERLHADRTSFSVHGQYARPLARMLAPVTDGQVSTPPEGDLMGKELRAVIEVTYGYSRAHREDLKQWMVAMVTSGEGVPQFLQPLDGNASDRYSLLEVMSTLTQHLQESGETLGIYVVDSALYGAHNMTTLNQAGVRWVSRAPETSTAAQALVAETPAAWQQNADGTRPTMHWLFQCFEGIDLHPTLLPDGSRWTEVLRLTDLHRLVLRLLGPSYEIHYLVFHVTAE